MAGVFGTTHFTLSDHEDFIRGHGTQVIVFVCLNCPCLTAEHLHDPNRQVAASRLARWLGLSDLDLAALVLVFAPEVDVRYERVFAYLQDDVTRKRPTLDLLAGLL